MAARGVSVLPTREALAGRAADEFAGACAAAVAGSGRFAVALSGGKTPAAMLGVLAARALPWKDVHVFWSDERCVPPDHPDSNYGTAREALLRHVPIPAANVRRMKGELPPPQGAADYRAALRAFFGDAPVFDLLFLGLGVNGHTASLFPDTPALDVTDQPCVETRVDGNVPSPWRLTFTYPPINAARRVLFLVEGADKAAILKEVLTAPRDVRRLPAQGVQPASGALEWLVDAPAASKLP